MPLTVLPYLMALTDTSDTILSSGDSRYLYLVSDLCVKVCVVSIFNKDLAFLYLIILIEYLLIPIFLS